MESDPESSKMSAGLSDLPDSLETYLDEQKEKPSELGMIDNDVLAFANQVGDDMEDSNIEGENFTTDLSFLAGSEDGKMEVAADDLAFLESGEFVVDPDLGSDEDDTYDEDSDGGGGRKEVDFQSLFDDEAGEVTTRKKKKRQKKKKAKPKGSDDEDDEDYELPVKKKRKKGQPGDDEVSTGDNTDEDDIVMGGPTQMRRRNIR